MRTTTNHKPRPLVLKLLAAFAIVAVVGVVTIFLFTSAISRLYVENSEESAHTPVQAEHLPKPSPAFPKDAVRRIAPKSFDPNNEPLTASTPITANNVNQVLPVILDACTVLIQRTDAFIYTWRTTDTNCQSQPEFFHQTGYGKTSQEAKDDYKRLVGEAADR